MAGTEAELETSFTSNTFIRQTFDKFKFISYQARKQEF